MSDKLYEAIKNRLTIQLEQSQFILKKIQESEKQEGKPGRILECQRMVREAEVNLALIDETYQKELIIIDKICAEYVLVLKRKSTLPFLKRQMIYHKYHQLKKDGFV